MPESKTQGIFLTSLPFSQPALGYPYICFPTFFCPVLSWPFFNIHNKSNTSLAECYPRSWLWKIGSKIVSTPSVSAFIKSLEAKSLFYRVDILKTHILKDFFQNSWGNVLFITGAIGGHVWHAKLKNKVNRGTQTIEYSTLYKSFALCKIQ